MASSLPNRHRQLKRLPPPLRHRTAAKSTPARELPLQKTLEKLGRVLGAEAPEIAPIDSVVEVEETLGRARSFGGAALKRLHASRRLRIRFDVASEPGHRLGRVAAEVAAEAFEIGAGIRDFRSAILLVDDHEQSVLEVVEKRAATTVHVRQFVLSVSQLLDDAIHGRRISRRALAPRASLTATASAFAPAKAGVSLWVGAAPEVVEADPAVAGTHLRHAFVAAPQGE